MKKIGLKQKLALLATLAFRFSNVTVQKSSDGSQYAILTLEQPIDHVRGSQTVEHEGKIVPVQTYDVTEIKIHADAMEIADEDFSFTDDEGTEGEYKGDKLILDVAKGSLDCWLTENSFASAASAMRKQNRNDRTGKVFARLNGQNANAPRVGA